MNMRALHRFCTGIIETSKIIENMIEMYERLCMKLALYCC